MIRFCLVTEIPEMETIGDPQCPETQSRGGHQIRWTQPWQQFPKWIDCQPKRVKKKSVAMRFQAGAKSPQQSPVCISNQLQFLHLWACWGENKSSLVGKYMKRLYESIRTKRIHGHRTPLSPAWRIRRCVNESRPWPLIGKHIQH